MLHHLKNSSARPGDRVQLIRVLSGGTWERSQEVEGDYDLEALLALDREYAEEPENRGKEVVVRVIEVNITRGMTRVLHLPLAHTQWVSSQQAKRLG